MPEVTDKRHGTAYAGLDFIKAAFCPLDFKAQRLSEHPSFQLLGKKDAALGELEVGPALHYPRQFPYTDQHGHRKLGTQLVTASFGLAPVDFDLFLGLFTYLKRQHEPPADGRSFLTLDFLARQLGLPAEGQAQYQRLRSRVFRFSYVKYTSSAFWNAEARSYDLKNFGFWNLASLSRVTESRRPIEFEWDPSLLKIVTNSAFLLFDYDLYRTLSPAVRRLYLAANREGWNQQDSSIFIADDFAIHQIGYSDHPERKKLRAQKLRHLLSDAEETGLIRPYRPWGGYFQTVSAGMNRGKQALRWTRGPLLKTKPAQSDGRRYTDKIENDALYAQAGELKDEHRKPLSPHVFRVLVARFGREKMQKHISIILAQKEHHPGSFTKSEIAAFIDRLQHDHADPDWYADLKRAERLSGFEKIQPNETSARAYETFFRR
jgi:hypothetical protein